jgi:hypothetical protein
MSNIEQRECAENYISVLSSNIRGENKHLRNLRYRRNLEFPLKGAADSKVNWPIRCVCVLQENNLILSITMHITI